MKHYSGEYVSLKNSPDRIQLVLDSDGSFIIAGENCGNDKIQGTWDYQIGDVGNYVDFKADSGYLSQAAIWDDGLGFNNEVQIGNCKLYHLQLERRKSLDK